MAMTVTLYSTSDPPNKVKKTLKTPKQISNVIFKEDNCLDVTTPTLIVNMYDDVLEYAKYNYVYIPKFTRYYYIEKMSTIGTRAEIQCKVDPLMSFKNDIIGSVQYVTRSQNINNRYMVDNLLPISSKHLYTIIPFGDKAYDENCINVILETAGKGGTI